MQSKFGHVVSIAFAALIVFGLIGSLIKSDSVQPAAVLVFTILGWAAGKIVGEGVASIKIFFTPKRKDKAE